MKRRSQASANFVFGPGVTAGGGQGFRGEKRAALLKESSGPFASNRSESRGFRNCLHTRFSSFVLREILAAAGWFAEVYRQKGDLRRRRWSVYSRSSKTLNPSSTGDFESFVRKAADSKPREAEQPSAEKSAAPQEMPAYAGSERAEVAMAGSIGIGFSSGMSEDAASLCAGKCDRRLHAETTSSLWKMTRNL